MPSSLDPIDSSIEGAPNAAGQDAALVERGSERAVDVVEGPIELVAVEVEGEILNVRSSILDRGSRGESLEEMAKSGKQW